MNYKYYKTSYNYKVKHKQRKSKRKRTSKIQEKNRIRDFRLYALKLERGYYYVGVTAYKDVNVRLKKHSSGKGAKWTKLHKPLSIIEVREIGRMSESKAVELEHLMTVEYVDKYGIHKVRGGKVCVTNPDLAMRLFNEYAPVKSRPSKEMMEEYQERLAQELSWIQ